MEKTSSNRLLALEGLRGVAAIVVVIFHTAIAFLPKVVGNTTYQHYSFESKIYNSPLVVLLSGTFAVSIFFVLSGFVLSIGFFQTGKESIIKKLAAKRYIRLMIPALVSILLAWFLMSAGLMHNVSAAQYTHSVWLSAYEGFVPNFFDALYQGMVGIFNNNAGAYVYNNVTWTMMYEFTGSIIIFAFCLIFGKAKYRWLIYTIMLLVTFNTWFIGFILGLILADAYANRQKLFYGRHWWGYALVAGLFLGGYSLGASRSSLYQSLSIPDFTYLQDQVLFLSIGAFFIVAAILSSRVLQKVLTKISRLGKYTFSLYLVHVPILLSLGSGVFVWLIHDFKNIHYGVAAAISVTIFALVTAGVTWLFERYIDTPAIRLSGRFADLVLQKPVKKSENPNNDF